MSKPKFIRANLQEILQSGAGLDLRKARELITGWLGDPVLKEEFEDCYDKE
jgi:hypothetical protein